MTRNRILKECQALLADYDAQIASWQAEQAKAHAQAEWLLEKKEALQTYYERVQAADAKADLELAIAFFPEPKEPAHV